MHSVETVDMFPVMLQSEALRFYLSKSSWLHYDQFRQTACPYQFCDFGPFLCSFRSYDSICFSVWNVKCLSSSFLLLFFPSSILTLYIVMMCTGWRAVWFVLVEDLSALRIRPAVPLPVELMSVVLILMLVFCIPCSLAFFPFCLITAN